MLKINPDAVQKSSILPIERYLIHISLTTQYHIADIRIKRFDIPSTTNISHLHNKTNYIDHTTMIHSFHYKQTSNHKRPNSTFITSMLLSETLSSAPNQSETFSFYLLSNEKIFKTDIWTKDFQKPHCELAHSALQQKLSKSSDTRHDQQDRCVRHRTLKAKNKRYNRNFFYHWQHVYLK